MTEATADSIATPVAPAAPDTPVEAAEHAHVCANCEARLQGPYCHACGQKGHLHGRLWHLAHEFVEGVAHFDGRLWRTLPLLAFNPGRLSRRWREGRRVRYVAPLHVFLFATFLLFLIPSFTGRHLFNAPSNTSVAEARASAEPEIDFRVGGEAAEAPPWVRRMVQYFDARLEKGDYYAYKIETLAYKLSFVLIPIQMLILAFLLLGKWRFTLYDHGVVALYGTGFLTLVVALVTALPPSWGDPVVTAVVFLAPVHAIAHLKGAYDLSWVGAVLRGLVLGFLSVIGFALFVFGVVALGLSG